jgi:hypothetical protein
MHGSVLKRCLASINRCVKLLPRQRTSAMFCLLRDELTYAGHQNYPETPWAEGLEKEDQRHTVKYCRVFLLVIIHIQ